MAFSTSNVALIENGTGVTLNINGCDGEIIAGANFQVQKADAATSTDRVNVVKYLVEFCDSDGAPHQAWFEKTEFVEKGT